MSLKKYFSFFKIRFSNGLQYRVAAIAGVSTQFFWGFMLIFLFKAFYESNPDNFPMEFSQLSSYIWLQQGLMTLFTLWFSDNEIFNNISDGSVAYELARPVDLYNMWFTKNLALRTSKAALRCLPIFAIAWFLPATYQLTLPHNLLAGVMFLITSILGAFLVCAFCMFIYIATFYTLNPMGIRLLLLSFTEILSGAIVPIPFFPDRIRKILEFSPFGGMQNLPLRIYSGNIAGSQMFQSFFLQIFWLIVILIIGKLWLKKAVTKVIIQGG